MARTSSLVFAGIAPHPPIMVPEVGREAISEVRASIAGMAEMTERVIKAGAETVVIISPHAPLDARAFVAYDGPQIYGDFANFRAPQAVIQAELDEALLKEISTAAAAEKLATIRIRECDLDHGTAVPLYFLQRNGWRGRVVALGYTFLSNDDHIRFGRSIRSAIEKAARPTAFVASGDLSHRLTRDAPAGFNPNAHLFDEEVVEAIQSNSPDRIVDIDPETQRNAGECGYRSMLVAIGVAEGLTPACEVISYEAPFGVGYLVAQLVASTDVASPNNRVSTDVAPVTDNPESTIPALARLTIETFVSTGEIVTPPEDLPKFFSARAGCFVSIKTRAGDLRGCIGTTEPATDTLSSELIANAISAATRDPRFPPVRRDELPDLKYSVDVLTSPEPCIFADLDPHVFGVIVEDASGRRGLLLPNLEGVDTATHQVEIAASKAGIPTGKPVKLFRFRADRYSE